MGRISNRLARIPPSATMAISARSRQLASEGEDVISFGAGEPDFPTPEHITAAAARAANDPQHHHYSANAGLPPLREAIAEYTNRYSKVPVSPDEVIVTNGAKQAVFQAFAALLDSGDEVLMPAPYWVTYPTGIELAGGVTVPVQTDARAEFKATVESLESHRTDKTKLLVFVSPSNPTGAVYSADEARLIGEWAADHGIWVMADEIYQRLSYFTDVAPSIASVTPRFDNWVLINGVSKSFAMTGWRVGWMVGPPDVVDATARHQSHATSNVANITQMAALAALESSQESVNQMREAFNGRRKLMYQALTAIPGVACVEPRGAFYTFPDVTEAMEGRWESSMDLATEILEESLVATVPGESFGSPGFLRLSYAVGEDEIARGIERIARLLAR